MIGKILKWGVVAKVLGWLAERAGERHEVVCPSCGATIRARMADRPEDGAGGEPPK